MAHTLDEERDMICHPLKWPMIVLPLKRHNPFKPGNHAVFIPPLSVEVVEPDAPIKIHIGNMYEKLSELPEKTYPNVDALLADGWRVD